MLFFFLHFFLLYLLVIQVICVHTVCFMAFSSTCEPHPCFHFLTFNTPVVRERHWGRGKGGTEPSAWRDNTITCSWFGQAKRSGRLLWTGCRPGWGRKWEQEEEGKKERQMEEGRGRGDGIQPNTACTGNTIKLPADLLGQTHTLQPTLSLMHTDTHSLSFCVSNTLTQFLTHASLLF